MTLKPDSSGKIKITFKGDQVLQDLARIILTPDKPQQEQTNKGA
jgi:hypothetical protein